MSIMGRNATQICTNAVRTTDDDGSSRDRIIVTALCDDGSIWQTDDEGEWYRLTPIPDGFHSVVDFDRDYDDVPEDLVL